MNMKQELSKMRPVEKSDPDPLLRSTRKPSKGLSPQTVGNWIKWI